LNNKKNEAYLRGERARPASPRPTPLWGWGCVLLFWGFFFFLGLFMFSRASGAIRNNAFLLTNGLSYEGRMAERYLESNDDSNTYYIVYEHDFREGDYRRKIRVSEGVYDDFELGAPQELLLDPDDPANFRLPIRNYVVDFGFPGVATGFSLLWIAGTVYFLYWYIFKWEPRRRKLIREGRVIYGRAERATLETDSDGDKSWKLSYEFQPSEGGPWVKGQTTLGYKAYDAAYIARLNAACAVAVIYLDDKNWEML
jgi:hypothetical protein